MFARLSGLLLCGAVAHGAVVRVELKERTDVLDGHMFGSAGPYERIVARVWFAADPKLPANRMIADLDKAPRNDAGQVEFSSDLYVLKPRDPAKGNGAVLFEVPNRGRKGMLSMFNFATGSLELGSAHQVCFCGRGAALLSNSTPILLVQLRPRSI